MIDSPAARFFAAAQWVAWAATLALVPIFVDEKLLRYKLWVLQTGLFAATLAWFLWLIFSDRPELKGVWPAIPVAAWVAYVAARYLGSQDHSVAASELARVIVCLCAFWLAANIRAGAKARVALGWIWAVAMGLVGIYGTITHFGGVRVGKFFIQTPQADRILSTFGNPIFLAMALLAAFWVSAGLVKSAGLFGRAALAVFMGMDAWAIWLTRTRATLVAAVFSGALAALMLEISRGWPWARMVWRGRTRVLTAAAALAIVLGIFSIKGGDASPAARGLQTIRSLVQRPQAHRLIWRDTVIMWRSAPAFGVGVGAFHLYFPKFAQQDLLALWPQGRFIVNDAHGEWYQVLAEEGIAGYFLFCAAVAGIFIWGALVLRHAADDTDRFYPAGLFAAAVAILTQNLFSVDMRFTISSAYLFTAFGLVASFAPAAGSRVIPPWAARITGVAGCVLAALIWRAGVYRPVSAVRAQMRTPDFLTQKIASIDDIHRLEEYLQKNPGDARLWFKLGYFWANMIKRGDGASRQMDRNAVGRAIEAFRQAAQIDPTVERGGAWNNLGNIYFGVLNDRKTAMGFYEQALKVNQNLPDAWLNLGVCYYYQGRLKQASDAFEMALRLDPNNSMAITMLKRMRE